MMNYIPKYEEEKFLYQGIISGEIITGYDFNINKYLDIFSELSIDVHFEQIFFVSVRPTVGVCINLFKE